MRWLIALLVCTGTAFAEPTDEPKLVPKQKRVRDAYLISIGATTAPIVAGAFMAGFGEDGPHAKAGMTFAMVGTLIGPSAGQWYAGEGLTTGLTLRLGGTAALIGLLMFDPRLEHRSFTLPSSIAAAVAIEVGIVWDFVTLPGAVRRYNREHALVPIVTGNGIALAGSF